MFLLDGEALRDPARAGGKAASLARLAGVAPVPPFVVLSDAAFDGDALRAEAKIALDAALPEAERYAVRSSGVGEDSSQLSHAGQFLSVLGVGRADVTGAVERVRRSAGTAHAGAYRTARGAADPVRMAVIVQRQLTPNAAGVAFSAHPVSGDRRAIVVSAVAGLADALVSGKTNGDEYALDRDGATLSVRLAGDAAVLGEADRARVAALARACEAAAGAPQDVEWAIADETLFLLQSRPITTLGPPPIADGAPLIWDNSNIVESYPGIVSPLTFSFARHTYARVYRALLLLLGVSGKIVAAHRPVLENLLGRVDGHVYYNLLNWYRTLALLPGFALNRRAMEEMMGVGAALPDAIADRLAPPRPSGFAAFVARARLGLVGARLAVEAIRLPARVRKFDARLAAALVPPDPPLATRSLTALAAEYRRLEALLLERWTRRW